MALIDNVLLHYKFNSDATDEHGSLDLTEVNSPAYASALLGNGIDFELGSSQYAYESTNAASINSAFSGTGEWTMAFWFKPESHTSSASLAGRWHATNAYKQIGTDLLNTGVLRAYVYTTSSVVVTGPTLSDGTWYHVVVWRSIADGKLYLRIDDTTTYSATLSGATNIQSVGGVTTPFTVGARSDASNYADGLMDSLTIWTRAITGSEITALYNSGSGFDYPFSTGGSSFEPIYMARQQARIPFIARPAEVGIFRR